MCHIGKIKKLITFQVAYGSTWWAETLSDGQCPQKTPSFVECPSLQGLDTIEHHIGGHMDDLKKHQMISYFLKLTIKRIEIYQREDL